MHRMDIRERIPFLKRELAFFEQLETEMNCTRCVIFAEGQCKKYGAVPAEFMAVGCEEFEWDDVPF